MKKIGVAVIVVVVAAIAAWQLWPRATAQVRARDPASAGRAAMAQSAGSAAGSASRVRKLSADQRRELGDKIRAALARSHAAPTGGGTTAAGSAPVLPKEPTIPLEQVTHQLHDALVDAIPLVAECYKQHGTAKRATAMMTMVSDPELGTVIDTEAITDRDGKPIDPKLDECMRNTIDALALPPLGQPGKLKVQYTFRADE